MPRCDVYCPHDLGIPYELTVVTNLARITGIIGGLRYILSTKPKILIYNSLFYSHVNYGQLLWGTATFSNLQKNYVMQKRSLRHVYNADFNATTAVFFP